MSRDVRDAAVFLIMLAVSAGLACAARRPACQVIKIADRACDVVVELDDGERVALSQDDLRRVAVSAKARASASSSSPAPPNSR